jgi:hypothetical protein
MRLVAKGWRRRIVYFPSSGKADRAGGGSSGASAPVDRTARRVIDLDYDDVDAAFAESVSRLCRARLDPDSGTVRAWSSDWWHALAELGVLALNTPDGGGGTDEIQRNIVGDRVLGLPGDISVDTGVPFRDVKVGTQR